MCVSACHHVSVMLYVTLSLSLCLSPGQDVRYCFSNIQLITKYTSTLPMSSFSLFEKRLGHEKIGGKISSPYNLIDVANFLNNYYSCMVRLNSDQMLLYTVVKKKENCYHSLKSIHHQ